MNKTVATLNTDLVKNDSMFFYEKSFYKKTSLKNSKTLRKC